MGIIADLSKYQGNVDFVKLAKVVDGVILRVQAGYTMPDPKYKEYVAGCKSNNIPFGTYAYFQGVNVKDAIEEAKSAFNLMDKDSKCFGLDVEEQCCYNQADLIPASQAFIDYLKNQGIKNVGLYSGEHFYNQYSLSSIKCDWKWIANYGVNDGQQHNPPTIDDDLWQFTSVGHLDGIVGNVDESVVTDINQFNFFTNNIVVKPVIIMHVKALVNTDIRKGPSHTAPYFRDAIPNETFDVYKILNNEGGQWHLVGGDDKEQYWIDGNNGQNLYWIDNPALKQQVQPAIYHKVVSGENVIGLAKKFGSTSDQIKSWNNLKDINKIFVGQNLRVR